MYLEYGKIKITITITTNNKEQYIKKHCTHSQKKLTEIDIIPFYFL